MAVLEEAVEHPVADLHGGAEHDGDVLQRHLVESLSLDHVHHVGEHVLDKETVARRQFLQLNNTMIFTPFNPKMQ